MVQWQKIFLLYLSRGENVLRCSHTANVNQSKADTDKTTKNNRVCL